MSANIKVTLSTSKLEVAAGESVEATIAIRNQSQVVDEFTIKIEGLDPTWWTLSVPSVSLFPGDQDEAKLTIRPPKEAEAKAGSYPFQVKAVSQANPQEATIAEAYLILRGFMAWEAEMTPTKVVGRSGSYRINIDNGSNADVNLVLEGKDPEESLYYRFDREEISVPAGESARVNLTVRPKKGEAKKQYNFKVTVRPVDKKPSSREVKVLNGQLEYPKRQLPWRILLIIFGVVAAAIAAWQVIPGLLPPPPPTISITSPKAGDSWLVGSNQNITWTETGTHASFVTLEYSTEGTAGRWNVIAVNAPNSGSYTWTVPNAPSATCVVALLVPGKWRGGSNPVHSAVFTIHHIEWSPNIPLNPINPNEFQWNQ